MKLTLSFACGLAALEVSSVGLAQQPLPATWESAPASSPPAVSGAAPAGATPPASAAPAAPPAPAGLGNPEAVSGPLATSKPESIAPNAVPMSSSPASPTDINSPAKTYEHRFSVTLDVANILWRTNRGYDLFSADDASWRVAVGAGYDVLKLPNQVVLAVEIGAMFEPGKGSNNTSGLLGDSLRASVSGSTVLLAGSLRWAVLPWLSPYGRLQVVASRYNIDIKTGGADSASGANGGEWTYHKAAGGGALGAGLMLNLPPRNPVNAGILLETGYWLQQSVDLVLENGEVSSGSIPVAGAKLGTLGNAGPYFRLAGVLRF